MRWWMFHACVLAILVLITAACSNNTPTTTEGTAPLGNKPQDKLSARLQQLSSPDLSAKDAQAQAAALNLPASGSGSLQRNDKGEVLVTVRMSDTSEANRAALQAAGATIINVATAFRTVTTYVRPDQLAALAALPAVEHLQEELRP